MGPLLRRQKPRCASVKSIVKSARDAVRARARAHGLSERGAGLQQHNLPQQLPPHPQLPVPQRTETHVHTPPLHARSQTFPQVPQLLGSDCMFTQTPLQVVYPGAHTHVPLEQTSPVPQLAQFGPQCCALLVVS